MPATPPATPCCEACGRADAVAMGDRWLCAECISIAGSCCPEFGSWDAWSQDDGVAPGCRPPVPPTPPPGGGS